MLTREEILSSDLATFAIPGGSYIQFTPSQPNNLFSKFSSIMATFNDTNTLYNTFQNTIKLVFLNYFKYYADCYMHYTFPKDEMANNMFYRDCENFVLNIYLSGMFKSKWLFTYFDLSPNETIERDYSRTEHAMTENSPINASITTLNNPSGKSQGDGTIDEDVSTTNLHNKVRAVQELAGNFTLKRIVEKELQKYVYELNKIY